MDIRKCFNCKCISVAHPKQFLHINFLLRACKWCIYNSEWRIWRVKCTTTRYYYYNLAREKEGRVTFTDRDEWRIFLRWMGAVRRFSLRSPIPFHFSARKIPRWCAGRETGRRVGVFASAQRFVQSGTRCCYCSRYFFQWWKHSILQRRILQQRRKW